MAIPDEQEVAATVARMEARFAAEDAAAGLFAAYKRLSDRFVADLDDRRDVLLSKAAALMLIREVLAES